MIPGIAVLVLLVGLFVLGRVTAKPDAAVGAAPGARPPSRPMHPALRATLAVLGFLSAGASVSRMVDQHRLNQAVVVIAGAPVVGERLEVGGLSVAVPPSYARLSNDVAAEVDRNVGGARFSRVTARVALVLMPRTPSDDRHPLATRVLVDARSTNTDPLLVTPTWCAAQGVEVAATSRETLLETEVVALPTGTSCRVRTSDPDLPARHTLTWILVVPGQDAVVVCAINSRSPSEREICENLVMGAELLPSA